MTIWTVKIFFVFFFCIFDRELCDDFLLILLFSTFFFFLNFIRQNTSTCKVLYFIFCYFVGILHFHHKHYVYFIIPNNHSVFCCCCFVCCSLAGYMLYFRFQLQQCFVLFTSQTLCFVELGFISWFSFFMLFTV